MSVSVAEATKAIGRREEAEVAELLQKLSVEEPRQGPEDYIRLLKDPDNELIRHVLLSELQEKDWASECFDSALLAKYKAFKANREEEEAFKATRKGEEISKTSRKEEEAEEAEEAFKPSRKEEEDIYLRISQDILRENTSIVKKGDRDSLDGKNVLHRVADSWCPELVRQVLLIVEQQNPNKQDRYDFVSKKDTDDKTPLVYAIRNADFETVRILIDYEPALLRVRFGSSADTPLHQAILLFRQGKSDDYFKILHLIVEVDPSTLCIPNKNNCPPYRYASDMRIPHEDPQDPQRLRARLLNNLKALIFRSHRDVGSLELALYKDGDKRKLLELDLSDFDVLGSEAQRCDFTHFVKNFSRPSEGLDFESTLASVQLPDISQARDRKLHQEVIDLLTKLRRPFGVEKIVSLTVWDNPFHPMSDLVIAESVRLYQIEELNWCKLDLDLDVLKNRATSLRKLCLYSSGNWGILYHWLSPEGLASTEHFRNLEEVCVSIVNTEGDRASDAHLTRLEHLAERTRRIYGRSGSRSIKFVVTVDLPHRLESSTIPVENEGSSDRFFRSFSTIHKTLDSPQTQNLSRSCQPANRIKIAIIDNGVDKWQTTISENIKKGISYMSKTHGHTLPWFTASHAHGTHMASLIRKVSPICDLYIYRVNSHRGDINAENVIKAIKDASREKVDIVNLSLTFDKNPPGLEDAINAAATREKDKALFFCATSDEPHHSGKVYPAHSPNTISVSAANRGGRRRMESKGDVDLLVLGENMAVEGPTYFTKPQGVASGSSVATALASGIASVLLVCAMRVCAKEGGDWEEFKRRDKMLMLFKEMQPDEKHKYIDPALLFQRKLQQNGEAWWHIFNPQRYP